VCSIRHRYHRTRVQGHSFRDEGFVSVTQQ
jgi:hypothetical protein